MHILKSKLKFKKFKIFQFTIFSNSKDLLMSSILKTLTTDKDTIGIPQDSANVVPFISSRKLSSPKWSKSKKSFYTAGETGWDNKGLWKLVQPKGCSNPSLFIADVQHKVPF